MIQQVSEYGFGQGCCDICRILKGWHRHWSTDLYYVINAKGKKLRYDLHTSDFTFCDSDVIRARNAVFCYGHAKLVEASRSELTDWEK